MTARRFTLVALLGMLLIAGHAGAVALDKIEGEPDAQPGGCTGIGCGPGSGSSVAYSPNGSYVAVAHGDPLSGDYATFYKVVGDDITKLTTNAPDTQPNGRGQAVAWHPNGTFVVVVGHTSPFVTLYERSSDTFLKRTVVGEFPSASGGFATDVSWNDDGTIVAVAHGQGVDADTLAIYTFAGTTLTYQQELATSGGVGQIIQAEFSPSGDYLLAAQTDSPYLFWWSESGGVFTPLSAPASDPGGTCFGVAWSNESDRVSCQRTSPSKLVVTYVRSGTTLGDKATFTPTVIPIGASWRPNASGTLLAIAGNDAPYAEVWERTGNTWAFAASPSVADQPNGNGVSIDWNPSGSRVVLGATSGDATGTKQIIFYLGGDPPGAPVLSTVPTMAPPRCNLAWTTPSPGDGTIMGYNVTRTDEYGGVINTSLGLVNVYVDPYGMSTQNTSYTVRAWSEYGNGTPSNTAKCRITPVPLFGESGALYGGDRAAFASALGVDPNAGDLFLGLLLIFAFAAAGYAGGSPVGPGVAGALGMGGALVGLIVSVAFALVPLWALLFLIVVGVGLLILVKLFLARDAEG